MGLFNKFLKKSELKNLEEKNLKEYQKMIPEKKISWNYCLWKWNSYFDYGKE